MPVPIPSSKKSLALLTAPSARLSLVAFNGLPWDRPALVRLALPPEIGDIQEVSGPRGPLPFMLQDGDLRFVAHFPAAALQAFHLVKRSRIDLAPDSTLAPSANALIENDWIRLACDPKMGISLLWKPNGAMLLENVKDFLVAQQDNGSFQIESPQGAEVSAGAGAMRIVSCRPSPIGSHLVIAGEFPPLSWAGQDSSLQWRIEFTLLYASVCLDLDLTLDWIGEGTRIRFKLPTPLDTAQGIYEIPFGVVRRSPSGLRGTARGEWPAHRFVAIESAGQGLALINAGTPGIEVNGGNHLDLPAPRTQFRIRRDDPRRHLVPARPPPFSFSHRTVHRQVGKLSGCSFSPGIQPTGLVHHTRGGAFTSGCRALLAEPGTPGVGALQRQDTRGHFSVWRSL